MSFGWITKDKHAEIMNRERANHRRSIDLLEERQQKEIEGFKAAIKKAEMVKARGRQPASYEDRYTIQLFADARTLHEMVRGNEKQMVRIMAMQFHDEALQMLLALSGLERIPNLELRPERHNRDWVTLEEKP